MKTSFEVNRHVRIYDDELSPQDNAALDKILTCQVEEFEALKYSFIRCLDFLSSNAPHDIVLEDWGDLFIVSGHIDEDLIDMFEIMLSDYVNNLVDKIDYKIFNIADCDEEFFS